MAMDAVMAPGVDTEPQIGLSLSSDDCRKNATFYKLQTVIDLL